MHKCYQWFRSEMIHLIPIILYFAICFNLFHFAQGLMMEQSAIRYTSYLGATLGAMLAGKVILIADTLPFINAFPHKPIICNIAWKFCIYSFFVFLVQFIDHFVRVYLATRDALVAFNVVIVDLSTPLFWGVQISVLMFFLIFIVFSELTRVIGKPKIMQIFFG